MDNVTYTLSIPTSRGNKIIPELGGKLSITGYDSKVRVTPFPAVSRNWLLFVANLIRCMSATTNLGSIRYCIPVQTFCLGQ